MPEDQLLAELIAQAVEKAVQPLQDRISALEVILAYRERDMADLRQTVASLSSAQEQDASRLALDIAYDRQRITKLEAPEPREPSQKVAEHLKEIMEALLTREKQCKGNGQKWDYMAFWEVEELLGLSHRRVSQLADIARNDPRFAIGWHPRKKNMKVFRLSHFSLGEISTQLHKVMVNQK